MSPQVYYPELRRRLGEDIAWSVAIDELGNLRTEVSVMVRLLRALVKEYFVEGDADWTRISELIAEEARTVLDGLRAKGSCNALTDQ